MSRYRLRSCVWELTLACTFRCRHCGSRAGEARENELTTAECLSVAGQLAGLGCRRVSLIGGEVFLRPDWDTVAAALTDAGVAVAVITNGFGMTDAILGKLKRVGVQSVAVSIDGTRELHDAQRAAGSFDRCLETIRRLRDAGVPATVITTLNGVNAGSLGALYRVLCGTGIAGWQIQACSPMGNASADGIPWRFDFADVVRFVAETAPAAPFPMGIADNVGYFTPDEGILRGDTSGYGFFPGCSAGISTVGIDSAGNVRGCESMYDDAFIEGNLRERSLREIWEDPDAFAYNRRFTPDMLTGACGVCPYGTLCRGGCRSYNYFAHGKLYESPACARTGSTEEIPPGKETGNQSQTAYAES